MDGTVNNLAEISKRVRDWYFPLQRGEPLLTTYWSESTSSSRWFGGPASRHESLNSLFPGSLISTFQGSSPPSIS